MGVYLVYLLLSYQRLDGRRADEHLAAEHPSPAPDPRHELLRDNALENESELGTHLTLLARRKGVHDPVDRFESRVRVKRRQREMPRLRDGQSGLHRLEIPHLSNEDHIRILAENVLERGGEVIGIRFHFSLVDDALVVLVDILDRILYRDDVRKPLRVDLAYDTVNPDQVYIGTQGTGLWKSINGGTNWEQVTTFPGAYQVASIATHPYVANRVFVQSVDEFGSNPRLHVSHDAGETWEELPCDACGVLAFAKTQPATLYTGTGNWKGLRRSIDGGYTWNQVMSFPAANIYTLATGMEGERVVVYVGIPGSLSVSSTGTLPLYKAYSDVIPGLGSVMGGGVYRLTNRIPSLLYLPIIAR